MALARARRFVGRLSSPFYRHQTFLWMWTPAELQDPEPVLPEGFSLVRGTEAHLPLLRQLDADFDRAREFLAAGHRLWLFMQGERVVYASWTFVGVAPTPATRSGWIELPGRTLHPEDSTTHPDYRRRGYATLAGGLIHREVMRELAPERYVFTALTTNTASLNAAHKGGVSRPFAVVEVTKIGLLRGDSGWRNRRADRALTLTRVRITQPEIPGGPTPADEEFLDWFRSAIRTGVRGPGRAAGTRPEPETVAAS